MRLGRDPDAEVDPRPARVLVAARVEVGDKVAFLDPGPGPYGERP
ncbi:MAG TPA: hypothetical protein VFL41_01390 [Gaiellaceae bacterium]|nr:hypothetical protein [Gaiellaceae bacterium]